MTSQTKKVLFFGIYNPNYSRNGVLMRGFRQNRFEIVECQADPRKFSGLKKYFELYRQYKKIRNIQFELIIVAFPGQSVVWLARLLFGNRIVFDAFLSLYNSNVFDRKLYGPLSFNGMKDYLFDYFSVRLAWKVLLDTDKNIQYFVTMFKLPKNKFIRVIVGADDELFYPDKEVRPESENFTAHFHGSFIPIQGVEYIVKSAKILSNDSHIHFRIIGKGQEYNRIRKLADDLKLTNIDFMDTVPFVDVRKWICDSDVTFGLLGNIDRIDLSVPNKVFESMACERAFITADSLAARELLIDGENAIFCKRGDENDLAEKILLLKNDRDLKNKIATNAYKLYSKKFTPRTIVKELVTKL